MARLSQAERARRAREREKKRRDKQRAAEKARKAKAKEKEKARRLIAAVKEQKKRAERKRRELQKRKVTDALMRKLRETDEAVRVAEARLLELEIASGRKKMRGGLIPADRLAEISKQLSERKVDRSRPDWVDQAMGPTKPRTKRTKYGDLFEVPAAVSRIEEEPPSVLVTREEAGVADTVDMYQQLRASGDIPDVVPETDFDLDISPRGAVASSHVPIGGILLTEANIEDLLHRAREAVNEARAWNQHVYAVVNMYQSEPTYEKNTDIGRAGGKPDGRIWEDPKDKSKKLFSTWQGVRATTADGILGNLETRLGEIVKANGKKNVALVHEIVIRSVLPDEMTRQQRQPHRGTLDKQSRTEAKARDRAETNRRFEDDEQ